DEGLVGGGHRVELSFGEADVERHVAAVFETELLEPGLEPFDRRMARRPRRVEDTDAERASRLLRLQGGEGKAEKHHRGEPEEPPLRPARPARCPAHLHDARSLPFTKCLVTG